MERLERVVSGLRMFAPPSSVLADVHLLECGCCCLVHSLRNGSEEMHFVRGIRSFEYNQEVAISHMLRPEDV